MATYTINLKELSTYEKEDLIKDFVSNPDENVSEDEAQTALANLFLDAQLNNFQIIFENKSYAMPEAYKNINGTTAKKNLWKRLLDKVCPFFDENTERNTIAEIVVNAIKNLIPGGNLLIGLLKKVVSYFLGKVHKGVCKSVDMAETASLFAASGKKRFNFKGNESFIIEATEKANKILESELFYNALAEIKEFDGTKITGKILGNLIKVSKIEANIELYKSKKLWSRTNAYTIPSLPDIIKLNCKKFNQITDPNKWTVTLIHEYVHLVDFENPEYAFGHNGNYRKNNENTAPYKVEEKVEELINNF